MDTDQNEATGLKLISLGFIAVIAIAGLVLMFTQAPIFSNLTDASITGNLAGMQKLGTRGIMIRTPYEACRSVRPTNPSSPRYVWSGDRVGSMIMCIDPTAPNNIDRAHWVDLQLKYG